jgi:hypothetical protein
METFLKDSGFTFIEKEGSQTLTLKKTVGDKIVEIQFESRYSYLFVVNLLL